LLLFAQNAMNESKNCAELTAPALKAPAGVSSRVAVSGGEYPITMGCIYGHGTPVYALSAVN
jgi:hypothetical protein